MNRQLLKIAKLLLLLFLFKITYLLKLIRGIRRKFVFIFKAYFSKKDSLALKHTPRKILTLPPPYKKTLILSLTIILFHNSTIAQNENINFETIKLQVKAIDSAKTVDDINNKAKILLRTINGSQFKSDTTKVIEKIKTQALLELMYVHLAKQNIDSVRYYGAKIYKVTSNNFELGRTEFYIAVGEYKQKNYPKALDAYERSVEFHKKTGNLNEIIKALFRIEEFYISISDYVLAESIHNELKTYLNNKDVSKYNKALIKLAYARILQLKNSYRKSLDILININVDDIESYYGGRGKVERYYYTLSTCYLGLSLPDKALIYAKKAFSTDKLKKHINSENILLGNIFLAQNKYTKVKELLDKCFNVPNYSQNNKLLDLHELSYNYYVKVNNFEKAFPHLKEHKRISDSINNNKTKVKSLLLNHRIKKDEEIKRLQLINETDNAIYQKDKTLYLISGLFIISILLTAFTLLLKSRKRKQEKIKTELKNAIEIGNSKKVFLENLSHEIRTPISVINGYLDLIKNNNINSLITISYSEKAIKSCKNMIKSFDNFLLLCKPEGIEYTRPITSDNMHNFILKNIFSCESCLRLKKQKLFYQTNIKPDISFDFNYFNLEKIILNLLSNAYKYSKKLTSIYITSKIEQNNFIFTISDEGIGISENDLPSIFSRFYRAKQTKAYEGFGVGLSLVNKLINEMKGTINVKSKINVGSIFTVSIPLNIENYELFISHEKKDFELLIDGTNHTSNSNSLENPRLPKALVVDDNTEMLQYLKDLLQAKFNCTYASDGERGYTLAKATKFDVIISDFKMPKMNGFNLKESLNKLENNANTPFILMTATPLNSHEEQNIVPGINDYIVKPFENEELLTRINCLIENNLYREKFNYLEEEESIDFNGSINGLIDKIKRLILDNITDPDFNVKSLAIECGYTQQHLNTILKSKVGLTPGKLILEVRLLQAYKYLLENKFQTLNEVIFSVGLSSRAYFNKIFVKRFGVKPSSLMKQYKK